MNSRYEQTTSNQEEKLADVKLSKESNNSGYSVDYVNNEAYLLKNGERIAGPYLYIYNDFEDSYIKEFRFVGENHKIGYIDGNGHECISPRYIEASKMSYNRALVKESSEDEYYFINTEGKKVTDYYEEAHTYEHQGTFARVKSNDGYWGIIDMDGNMIFNGADSIEKLPNTTSLGAAVIDGHAVIFRIKIEDKVEIVKSLEKYKDISEIYFECFAIVKDDKENCGVIDAKGNEIIPVKYTDIDFDVLYSENWYGSHVVFKLKKDDGYDIMEINFNE